MSTFYAVFQDPRKARLAAMALLNQGVPTDDISLVARGDKAVFGKVPAPEMTAEQPMADATDFVERNDDPKANDRIIGKPDFDPKYALVESPFGGGISTATPNDSAPTVDETDDSQWLSEPEDEEVTQADRELRDLDLAVDTGFPTVPSDLGVDETPDGLPVDDLERSLEAIDVPGFGVVIGGGPLATSALDYGDGDPSDDVHVMMTYFREEGVPDEIAGSYMSALDSGQALLAVGLVPGEVEPPLVEAVADQFGAKDSATFDAPRY